MVETSYWVDIGLNRMTYAAIEPLNKKGYLKQSIRHKQLTTYETGTIVVLSNAWVRIAY